MIICKRELFYPIDIIIYILLLLLLSALEYFPGFFGRFKYEFNNVNISLIAKLSVKLSTIVCKEINLIKPDQFSSVHEISFTQMMEYYNIT